MVTCWAVMRAKRKYMDRYLAHRSTVHSATHLFRIFRRRLLDLVGRMRDLSARLADQRVSLAFQRSCRVPRLAL